MAGTGPQATDPQMDALIALKHRLGVGIVYLQHNRHNDVRFEGGCERLVRLMVREYLPALSAGCDGTDRRTLHRQRRELKRRLNRGWSLPSTTDETVQAKRDALWADLLAQYEVLTDVLRLDNPDERKRPSVALLDRIAAIHPLRMAQHAEAVA